MKFYKNYFDDLSSGFIKNFLYKTHIRQTPVNTDIKNNTPKISDTHFPQLKNAEKTRTQPIKVLEKHSSGGIVPDLRNMNSPLLNYTSNRMPSS